MPCDYSLLPHPGIQTLAPYVPGKSIEAVAREQGLTNIIKLASNENPLGCSSKVIEALTQLSPHRIATYPIATSYEFPSKLAAYLGIPESQLTVSNGSDALFPLLLTCFALHRNKHALIHEYAFIAYSIYAKTLGIPVVNVSLHPNWEVDIEALIQACTAQTALIFLANPNNPTGIPISYTDIKHLLTAIPDSTIVVLDEAYYEYHPNPDANASLRLLADHSNLVITRTFSKAYGLAGLRLGYAIAHQEITAILQRAMPPFTINQAALVAGSAALEDPDFIKETAILNTEGLQQLQQGLNDLGLDYLPTAANFITVNFKTDTTALYQALQQQGVIVRPLHPYGLNDYMRISTGTLQQNKRFLDTLAICLKGKSS